MRHAYKPSRVPAGAVDLCALYRAESVRQPGEGCFPSSADYAYLDAELGRPAGRSESDRFKWTYYRRAAELAGD